MAALIENGLRKKRTSKYLEKYLNACKYGNEFVENEENKENGADDVTEPAEQVLVPVSVRQASFGRTLVGFKMYV